MRFPILLCLCAAIAGAQTEYHGKVSPELQPAPYFGRENLQTAPAAEVARLPHPPIPGERAYAGAIAWTDASPLRFLLLEGADRGPLLFIDANLDGKFSSEERVLLSSEPRRVDVRLPSAPFRSYPLLVRLPATGRAGHAVMISYRAFAQGFVEIGGAKTLVEYEYHRKTASIDPRNGTLGIDLNHDGRVERHSYERDYANNETIVFRLGSLYLSTEKADLKTGEILLRSHPRSDYRRIELSPGTEVPDFSFTTLDGRRRKLSEFSARYLLLDFWGTWCAPCVAEIPLLKDIYDRYHSRGLEIIGMNNDDDPAAVRKFLDARGATWPQAREDSIRSLIRDRFRIQTWPFWILLDAQHRIVSSGGDGQDLTRALEALFP